MNSARAISVSGSQKVECSKSRIVPPATTRLTPFAPWRANGIQALVGPARSGWLPGWGGERGLVPHPLPLGFGTPGQAEVGSGSTKKTVGFRGRHHPGMVGGIIPEWVGQVPKSRAPDSAERTGAPHVAQGGWGATARHSCIS
jgi:hypothetical protein